MFNGSYGRPSDHVRTTEQQPSSSSSRVGNTTGDLPPSAFELQDDFSRPDLQYQNFAQAPDVASTRIQSTFPHPIPVLHRPGNPSREPGPYNMPATSSSWGHGSHTSTYYGQPTPVTPAAHVGQTVTAGTTFAEHTSNQTPYHPRVQPPPPQVYAMPNAQGIPTPIWQLYQTWIDYEGGDDLRLTILFKKVRT